MLLHGSFDFLLVFVSDVSLVRVASFWAVMSWRWRRSVNRSCHTYIRIGTIIGHTRALLV
jgi:hypothetical protein